MMPNLAELQEDQRAKLVADATRVVTVALDILDAVERLRATPDTGPEAWEHTLAENMGSCMNALVSAHVRYSAFVAMRIAELERKVTRA